MRPPNYLNVDILFASIADGTAADPQPAVQPPVHCDTSGETTFAGNAAVGGDRIGRDQIIHGDEVHGDKIAGDKIAGDKIVIYVTAAERPVESASPLLSAEITRESFEPETLLIPAGRFLMGHDAVANQAPQHLVDLPAFRIGKAAVTNRQFVEFVRNTKRLVRPEMGWNGQTPPADQLDVAVRGVTFIDALAYCQWLSSQTGRAYGLPHEAAWARATSTAGFAWGTVHEWTCTIWGEKLRAPDPLYAYPWQADGRNDPTAGAHLRRVMRGIDAANPHARGSASVDQPGVPGKRHGLRVMLSIDPGERL